MHIIFYLFCHLAFASSSIVVVVVFIFPVQLCGLCYCVSLFLPWRNETKIITIAHRLIIIIEKKRERRKKSAELYTNTKSLRDFYVVVVDAVLKMKYQQNVTAIDWPIHFVQQNQIKQKMNNNNNKKCACIMKKNSLLFVFFVRVWRSVFSFFVFGSIVLDFLLYSRYARLLRLMHIIILFAK